MTALLRLGTRASALALAQSGQIASALRELGADVEIVQLQTPGDVDSRPLPGRAHEGIFVSSVRDALVEGSIDFAVHSFKDLPTGPSPELVVAAVPPREDPRDVLVSRADLSGRGIGGLPAGARVGTCSARRAAWVHRHRPDVFVVPVRGNIDERIARVVAGEYDAIVLAAAGLNRLACITPARESMSVEDLVPAPAQGALALECRAGDATTRRLLRMLDHEGTHLSALAEREVLAAVDPTDLLPVGAVATLRDGLLHLLVDICDPDGCNRTVLRASASVPRGAIDAARALGVQTAVALLRSHSQTAPALAS